MKAKEGENDEFKSLYLDSDYAGSDFFVLS